MSRPLVSGINFAHLALASEPWPGTPTIDSPYFPPRTPAPLVCCSAGHAPFWLPPHSGGGVLHMLIVGPTGAGKSVLLALMAMAWTGLKGARVRWLDLDYSSFVAAHALGADYRELGNEGTPALCPLEACRGVGRGRSSCWRSSLASSRAGRPRSVPSSRRSLPTQSSLGRAKAFAACAFWRA